MKVTLVYSVLTFLLIAAAFAKKSEGQGVLDKKVTISIQNENFRSALRKISRKAGITFSYSRNTIPDGDKVSITANDEALSKLFATLFDPYHINYEAIGNQVVLKRKLKSTFDFDASNLLTINEAIPIKGIVRDDKGNPLVGVSVQVKGTTLGTSTNERGEFSLNVAEDAKLVFSFVGYGNEEVSVVGKTSVDVVLHPSVSSLEDVVVVGYGTQKKISMTSAVSQVKGDDLVKHPVSNLQQALQGQAPGLSVLDRGGNPGQSAATIRVRGITSFSGNNDNSEPLIIVDGVEQPMFNLNPEDIESISILKDASSTAIYGSRAANGVLLITTKRGRTGKVEIQYNGYFALQKATNSPENMNTVDYMQYEQLAYNNQRLPVPAIYSDSAIQAWASSSDRYKFPLASNWFREVLKTAPQHSHTLSLSGGNEFARTRLSFRYMDQGGIAPNYGANIREFRINNDMNINKKLKLSTDFNYRYNLAKSPFRTDVFNRFLHGTLFTVPKYPDGTYGLSPQGFNPLLLAEKSGYRHIGTHFLFGSGKLDYEVIDGLRLTAQVSAVTQFTEEKDFQNRVNNYDSLTKRRFQIANNNLTEARNRYFEMTTNYLANYSKDIGKHQVKGLLGFSEIYHKDNNLSAYRERFYNNQIQSISQGANDATKTNGGGEAEFGLRSFFARFNYSFDEKYLFEVNGRYDGSSRFTGDKKYSFFPSVSAAWRLSEEKFFANLKSIINELKLRGSWGQTGNQTVPLYSYFASLSQGAYSFGGQSVMTLQQTVLADPNITWETNTETDIGIDASLFENRLSFTADFYTKRTSGILLALPLPVVTGFSSSSRNAGTMDNTGVELSVGYNNNFHKIRYSVTANAAYNKNKVIDLKGGGPFINSSYDLDPRYIVKVGLPFNTLWGYKTDGYFQTQEEIDHYPTIAPNTKPGDVKYVDLNGDGVINADDWTNIGNPFPKYTFGAVANLSYSRFTINMLFQGAADVDTRLSGALSENGIFEGFTPKIVTNNYWTPDRPNAKFPLPRKSDQRNVNTSDRLVIDGTYLRLKNMQLLYALSPRFIERVKINSMNIFISVTDILTFSKLNEWHLDPEIPSGRGDYYPQTRLYTVGVNLNF